MNSMGLPVPFELQSSWVPQRRTSMQYATMTIATIVTASLALLACPADAAVTPSYNGIISGIRVENGTVLLGMNNGAAGACGVRVWVDPSSPDGRAHLAIATTAYVTGKTVLIRADDTGPRRYGACPIYDLVIGGGV